MIIFLLPICLLTLQLIASPVFAARESALGESLGFGSPSEEPFLRPDQAFIFSTEAIDGNAIAARWQIADGYYLYRDKFKFSLKDSSGITLGDVILPPGKVKDDEFFGPMEVYYQGVEAGIALKRSDAGPHTITLQATYQGCAEAGICYPPIDKIVPVELPAVYTASPSQSSGETNAPALSMLSGDEPEQDRIARFLKGSSFWLGLLFFFGAGLGLAFTPCVFPMIPILSSLIVGQGEGLTTRKAFVLSLTYVLVMALSYTVAGVVAGLFGSNLQAAFQNPWILGTFSGLFVLLALSMFGLYTLQMPASLQSRLTQLSNRQAAGGTLAGAAIMGFFSALIVGPCVAAPLAGALIVIGQTGDALLGGGALFALSLGMGMPLLLIGTSAGKLLPKAGSWMNTVKAVFGVLLLALAIWMLERIVSEILSMALWAILLIGSAVYLGALEPLKPDSSGWHKLWKGVGLILLIQGALLMVGAAAGGRDVFQPLKGVFLGDTRGESVRHLTFLPVKTLDNFQDAIRTASAARRPVMLDVYADWCVECKRMEKATFSDPGVRQALSGVVATQADVTSNDEEDQTLLRHFGLVGPPAILFFGSDGQERKRYRLLGFMEAGEFQNHVERALR
jgi:Thiol:disulfide interchange protein